MPRLALAILAVLLVAAPSLVRAQSAEGADLEAEARARFDLGEVHLRNGRFVEAAHEFEQAYELSGHYELLYNIHLAYRDAGEPGQAADALARYLDEAPADVDNRTNLEARLETLRRQAADGQTTGGGQDTQDADSEPSDEAPTEVTQSGGPGALPFVLIGVGGAAIVGGVITGIIALGISNDLAATCTDTSCSADKQSDADTGQALAITTDVLIGVGIAAAAVGVILFFTGGSDDETDVALGGACVADGCMAAVRGSF